MIDLVCPDCADEMEIDPADLADAETIGCEECGCEFAFELKDGQILIGEILVEGEDFEDDGELDDELDDDETAIEVEDEDEEA